jgi:hypothetical protein
MSQSNTIAPHAAKLENGGGFFIGFILVL